MILLRLSAAVVLSAVSLAAWPDEFDAPVDTQSTVGHPLTPAADAVQSFTLPPGFHATLFAAEPDVRQPIAMTFDPRGRLWVAENYSYVDNKIKTRWDGALHDRIVIFADTTGDGHFHQRTVFWDKGHQLTSIEIGFGGVFALCPPNLLFIPDANGDDVPDGEPQIVLNSFDIGAVGHTIANGLKWGPDGWLYGRHGILGTSVIGLPGTPAAERLKLSCGIWRYHPTRKVFEVLAHGTTNPWGMDWDAHGECFFINTVIGHLWHLIPGAHYRRMSGEDPDPHTYGLIEQHADHVHWATNEQWQEIRKGVSDATSRAGGGHAHSGLMIYQGANWPEAFRDKLFTVNYHGRRLNTEVLERAGSGFVGRRGDDVFQSGDIWFRGVELGSGPDGGVFVLDWSDIGECHDNDGIHRNSGRIYKFRYGEPAQAKPFDLRSSSDRELVELLNHADNWYARQARQLLQGRAAAGRNLGEASALLRQQVTAPGDAVHRLRALWALNAIGGCDEALLLSLLEDGDEHLRTWGIRLLTDSWPLRGDSTAKPPAVWPDRVIAAFSRIAGRESSPFVRLALAAALQRLPVEWLVGVAKPLLAHGEDADDHNLPLMLWWGVKALAESDPAALVELADGCAVPTVRINIARRLAEDIDRAPQPLNALINLNRPIDDAFETEVVLGLAAALKGRRSAAKPEGWGGFAASAAKNPDAAVRNGVRDLSVQFGDDSVLDESRRLARDAKADAAQRRSALQALIDAHAADLRKICEVLADDPAVNALAVRGLAQSDDPAVAALLLKRYRTVFGPEARAEALTTLVSRPAFAKQLLAAIGDGPEQVPRTDLSAFLARQIRSFNDAELDRTLVEVWGELHDSPADKLRLMADWKKTLTSEALAAADRSQGRLVFATRCAVCHKLYGEGGVIGPDLTGAGRDNLAYLVENIVDPSAVVAVGFRLAVVTLKDGRVVTGMLGARTVRTVTIQVVGQKLVFDNDEVAGIQQTNRSLMPDGLLESMTPVQVHDLIAYLMSKEQIPLPGVPVAK